MRRCAGEADSEKKRHSERERLFSAVVESSNDAIITKDLDGTITGWNRAAERLFGYSASEAVGRRIDLIVPAERHAEVADILERVGRGEVIEQYETVRVHKNGKQVFVSLGVSPLRSATAKSSAPPRPRAISAKAGGPRTRSGRRSRNEGAFSRLRRTSSS